MYYKIIIGIPPMNSLGDNSVHISEPSDQSIKQNKHMHTL